MLNKLRNFGKEVWDIIKTIVAPAFISIGGTVSAVGGSLFILPKFVKFLTNKDDHPASLYSSFTIIVFSVIISLATRFPAIFRHFNTEEKLPEKENQEIDKEFQCNPSMSLWLLARSFEYFAKTNSVASAGFMLLGSYLNAITFIEFLSKQTNSDPHEGIAEYITQTTALLLAVCATGKYAIFTLKKAVANAKHIAHNIENRNFPTDRAALITFAVSSFSTLAVPFLGYFSTTNALGKIPLINLPYKVKRGLAFFSSVSSTSTHLTTQVPPLYAFLSKNTQQVIFTEKPWWETPSKVVVFGIAGIGDFASTNISVFTSVNSTCHDVFGINAKQPVLIAACSVTALSTATLNYFFSVYRGYEDTLLHYHIARGEAEYVVIKDKDIESGQTTNTSYQNSPAALFFSKKPPLDAVISEEEEDLALSLTA